MNNDEINDKLFAAAVLFTALDEQDCETISGVEYLENGEVWIDVVGHGSFILSVRKAD